MFALQTTLGDQVVLAGNGVHSDAAVAIALRPAPADTGIVFRRRRAGCDAVVEASWSSVGTTELCTVLGDAPEARIATVEHLMAAFAGLGVDNAIVTIDGPEVPIMDGSAAAFVDAIDEAGIEPLEAPRRFLQVLKPVRAGDGRAFCELMPRDDGLRLDVEIDFASAAIGHQRRVLDLAPGAFRRDVARARTFGNLDDVERLWQAGFARGASLDNTVAVKGDRVINPEGLRFGDEFVRHKLLDAIGDLALAGMPILGEFRSYRGGHKLNVALLRALFADRSNYAVVEPVLPRRRVPIRPLHDLPSGAVIAASVAA